MIRSHDDLIRVEVIANANIAGPVAADFSIINLPLDAALAKESLNNIFNSPTMRHITLILNRHRRKDKVLAMTTLKTAIDVGFEYLDTVSIWYDKPSSCSNNGFLPVCEVGYLFYKGAAPDVGTTAWFGDGTSNATNMWAVTPQELEKRTATYYQKFAWEIPLLLLSMAQPLEHRRFIYNAELTEQETDSLFRFCKNFNMAVQLYTTTEANGLSIIRSYNTDYAK